MEPAAAVALGSPGCSPDSKARRHLNTWFAFTQCARATSARLASGSNVNCSICRFPDTRSPAPKAYAPGRKQRGSATYASKGGPAATAIKKQRIELITALLRINPEKRALVLRPPAGRQ